MSSSMMPEDYRFFLRERKRGKMKLRIAHYASQNRMAGEYVIEKRVCFFWWTMATEISDGAFEDFHSAYAFARDYLLANRKKRKPISTWRV